MRLILMCVLACAIGAGLVVSPVPLRGQAPPVLILTRELRIDAAEQDLTPISYLAVSPNGTIVVAQNQDGLVRFFGANGAALGTFGRKGQGPGEFQSVGRLTWIGDTLVVGDLQNRRFTLISPDRKLVRSVLWIQNISGPAPAGGDAPRARGSLARLLLSDFSQVLSASVPDGASAPEWLGGPKPGYPIVRVDSAGALRRVIAWIPTDECSARADFPGGGYGLLRIPYCATPMEEAAMEGTRFMIAYLEKGKNTYRLEVLRTSGDTVFARSYPFVPVSIPGPVKDSAKASRVRGVPEMRAAAEKMQLPDAYPPLARILSARDETTWVELYSRDGDRNWQVLDARGSVIGRVRMPRSTEIKVASAALIWVTETDDDGLQHIVRYRVSR